MMAPVHYHYGFLLCLCSLVLVLVLSVLHLGPSSDHVGREDKQAVGLLAVVAEGAGMKTPVMPW
jgi:hypothetical protein